MLDRVALSHKFLLEGIRECNFFVKQVCIYYGVEHKMHLNFEIKTGDFKKILSSVLDVSGFAASAVNLSHQDSSYIYLHTVRSSLLLEIVWLKI